LSHYFIRVLAPISRGQESPSNDTAFIDAAVYRTELEKVHACSPEVLEVLEQVIVDIFSAQLVRKMRFSFEKKSDPFAAGIGIPITSGV
jgi:hypothetical protein